MGHKGKTCKQEEETGDKNITETHEARGGRKHRGTRGISKTMNYNSNLGKMGIR